ncbi:MAG: hypothetical protein MI785_01170 [Kiloniellales bacterium]|nr:hypothetical protein [Kiloniellales bacterium]
MVKTKTAINEKALSKGEVRKLNALRKSLGDQIAEEAFTKWLAQQANGNGVADPNIELIENALSPLMDKVRIPRGAAYAVRRGRGRFIVEPVDLKA